MKYDDIIYQLLKLIKMPRIRLLAVADLGGGALGAIAPSPKKNFRFFPAEKA